MSADNLDTQIASDSAAEKRYIRTFASDMAALQGGDDPKKKGSTKDTKDAKKEVGAEKPPEPSFVPPAPPAPKAPETLEQYQTTIANDGSAGRDADIDLDHEEENPAVDHLIASSQGVVNDAVEIDADDPSIMQSSGPALPPNMPTITVPEPTSVIPPPGSFTPPPPPPFPSVEQEPVPTPPSAPVTPPTPAPAPEKPAEGSSPIETYTSDFIEHAKNTDATPASIIAAEEDAKNTPIKTKAVKKDGPNGKTLIAVVVGSLLIIGGAIGVYAVYSLRVSSGVITTGIAPTLAAPIFVDSTTEVQGVGATLAAAILQKEQQGISPNTVQELSFATSTGASNVFLALNLSLPDILQRNIHTTGGMAGLINTGSTTSPFFIINVDSYSATFSGMLSWEATMPEALKTLFPPYTTGTASSTASSTPPQSTQKLGFIDETILNHDVRVYKNAQGETILMYGYWNPSTLVIARDRAAFTEILTRLQTSHAQ